MKLRTLTSADAEEFHSLHIEGVETYPTAFLRSVAEVRATSPKQTAHMLDSGKMTGAFSGDALVGFAGLGRNDFASARHRAQVGPFYVNPAFQGQGTAQALMDALVTRALDLGCLQMELYVWSGNPRAQRFYTRNDFEQVGVVPRSVIIDCVPYDDLFMVRLLDR